MAEAKLLELPYEKIAMAGGEMPHGLEYPDQLLFQRLRLLYDAYKKKIIDREAATREKVQFLQEYEANRIGENAVKECADLIKRTEIARANYRKERTLENADILRDCIEGRKQYG